MNGDKTASSPDSISLKGSIHKIVYYNDENSYLIARFIQEGKTEPLTIIGTVSAPVEGQHAVITGRWEYNPKFGSQFRITDYRESRPSTCDGIEKFLGSGLIPGIGPEMAKRIVKRFGEDTLSIIDDNPRYLTQVEGIGSKRVDMILSGWKQHRETRHIIITLNDMGLSSGLAQRVYAKYKNEAVPIIQQNPYRLAYELRGVGFHKADQIALASGKSPASPERITAAVYYFLHKASDGGHVYLPRHELVERLAKELSLACEPISDVVDEMASKLKIIIEPDKNGVPVYLKELYEAEHAVAAAVAHMIAEPVAKPINTNAAAILTSAQMMRIQLNDKLAERIAECINRRLFIITGGPGTGKTTVVKLLLALLRAAQEPFQMAAPTGRAAKRLQETTGCDAVTLHRLLEYLPATEQFQRNALFPLESGTVIVDEVSMVDITLMRHLIGAIRQGARLILVGDADQLPSVGPGDVLRHLLSVADVPVIKLTKIFRQAHDSYIVTNAHRINEGEKPVFPKTAGEQSDFYFIEKNGSEEILSLLKKVVVERIPASFGFNPFSDVQVLAPMRKGVLGVENLNRELQALLNSSSEQINAGFFTYKRGDKVMQTSNNYDLDVYNGDIGLIAAIDKEAGQVTVDYYGRTVVYEQPQLHEISPAYAISVHKSQGSEYSAVVMPLSDEHYIMLQRNLLYTAVTRAKKLVVLIGSNKALYRCLQNNRIRERYTYLADRCRFFMPAR